MNPLALITAGLTFLPKLIGLIGDLPKAIALLGQLRQLIIDAESTTLSGPDKLTKVLNDFEAAIYVVDPALAGSFTAIATDVATLVNVIVADFNAFKKAIP